MYIFDFEDTLSDASERQHLFPTKKDKEKHSKKFLQFKYNNAHSLLYRDKPKLNNCKLYSACRNIDYTIILTAVRDIKDHREQLDFWFRNQKLKLPHKIIMRPENNFQSSPDFKLAVCKRILKKTNVIVFDDREDVIRKLIENNIPGVQLD